MRILFKLRMWLLARRAMGWCSSPDKDIFLLSTSSRPVLGAIQQVQSAPSPGMKRSWREVYYSSAEVRNGGAIPPLAWIS
jgi:hypothetical protein